MMATEADGAGAGEDGQEEDQKSIKTNRNGRMECQMETRNQYHSIKVIKRETNKVIPFPRQ